MSSTLIRNATIVTMNDDGDVLNGAVSIRDRRIASIGSLPDAPHDTEIDAGGAYLLPGFVQTHVHLCQTIFRGLADDLRLLDWLRTRIWPLEAAHTPSSLRAAARLACHELLLSGTTTILTMETVHDTNAVFEAVAPTGIRAVIGKCLMDAETPGAPVRLRETTRAALDESVQLQQRWNGAADGRMGAAFAPRFALSCTRELLEAVAEVSTRSGALVHTHASEQPDETALVRRITGRGNVEFFEDVGLLSPRLNLAHCVWTDAHERALLAARSVRVTHCPGSNMKLGSGIAPVPEMLERGICVSLGSDGAACNNHLDMFGEMRLAATLQALRLGPGALPSKQALRMATRNGARALGLEAEIGSVEVGKRADLILIGRATTRIAPDPDPYSTIVYAATPADVTMTMVDGTVLARNGTALTLDGEAIAAAAHREVSALAVRAGL